MDLEQYKQDALRTEAGAVTTVRTNELLLISVVRQIVMAGQLLDQIKKHVFYGRDYDETQLAANIEMMADGMKVLSSLTTDEIANDEREIDVNSRVFHAVVGMTTEAVELLEALRFYGDPMDEVNMLEEIGDSSWYQAVLIDELGGNWDDILHRNIAKLRARFPDKFDSERANARDLDTERDILEGARRDK